MEAIIFSGLQAAGKSTFYHERFFQTHVRISLDLLRTRHTARSADAQIAGLSVAAKNELLFQHGINFNDLPSWQKRGVGIVWERYEQPGFNPHTGEAVLSQRRRLQVMEELPMHEAYSTWLAELMDRSSP